MFNLKAGNHEVILTSETYNTKQAAESGIASVQTNSPNDERYERKKSTGGEPFFVLKATNGQTIGSSSQGYKNKADCEKAVDIIKKGAMTAEVADMTT